MTIRSHPSEATLLAYATGTLAPGASLVLAAHLSLCKDCHHPLATWETAAGALLDSMPESEIASDAFERTMALARAVPSGDAQPKHVARSGLPGVELPSAILAAGIAKRRWLAPGIWSAAIPSVSRAQAKTYILRLGPNRKVPLHGHSAAETICILKGSFLDAGGRYQAGDFIETDEAIDHQPVAGGDGDCICIIATEGPLRIRGFLGWLLSPFAG